MISETVEINMSLITAVECMPRDFITLIEIYKKNLRFTYPFEINTSVARKQILITSIKKLLSIEALLYCSVLYRES